MASQENSSPVKDRHFMHSVRFIKDDFEAVIIKERRIHKDGSESTDMRVHENPHRPVYITKPQHRVHEFKLELEVKDKLEMVMVPERFKMHRIAQLLGLPRKRFYRDDEVLKSPYIYGANISIEALIKMRYIDAIDNNLIPPRTGFLDIENDTLTQEINLISFLAGNKVYVAALKSKMWKKDSAGNRHRIDEKELHAFVTERLKKYLDDKNFKLKFKVPSYEYIITVCDDATAMLAATFKAIHKEKVDFIGTWGDHDVKTILLSINDRTKFSPEVFFTDPNLDPKYRYFKYDDGSKSSANEPHWTLRWSWVSSPCPSQFLNLMALYSHTRKTSPYLQSYKLEDMLTKHIGVGKMEMEHPSHDVMANQYFREYTAYNIFDVIGLDLMERSIQDVYGMHTLAGATPVKQFNRAVVRSLTDLYHYNINKGFVTSCPSSLDPYLKIDSMFPSTGGTVLPPYLYNGPSMEIS